MDNTHLRQLRATVREIVNKSEGPQYLGRIDDIRKMSTDALSGINAMIEQKPKVSFWLRQVFKAARKEKRNT